MVSCLSVSLKPRANTDTQVAFPGSWLVKFRNKREKDRRKKEEKEKKIRSQDVKHRCLKSRKVFSLSRLCPDAVFIFNEYRYAEKEKREGWGFSPFSFNAAHGRSSTNRNYAYRVPTVPTFLPHLDLYFFYALFIGESSDTRTPLQTDGVRCSSFSIRKIVVLPYFVVTIVVLAVYFTRLSILRSRG